ncbi:site-2 protease family protein [Kocuria sp. cx-116]|uniref:site-2 protease family protein n=1 Tax=Kocuria sp. cx-116 TaxID=2771378 RepID=UPI001688A68A|nr:site-2 protease family protein [Kocuria sp. cx-116]MBD2761526.1 site-2 protease family protein [Kocuria sp. cx-116]
MSGTTAARRGLRLARVGGVDVHLDRSWFVIAVLTVVLYGPILWRLYPELGWLNLVVAFGFALGLAVSVLVHELAHALVGRAAGWPVGRIVLTLMGGHTTFGAVRASPGSTAVVSLVGPIANVILAGIGTAFMILAPAQNAGPGWALLQLLVLANWILGLFNLLPGLPLDGGRVVEALVWRLTGSESKGTTVAAWSGRGLAVLVLMWVVFQGLWRSPITLLITLMIAAFIFTGASQALMQARVLERVRPLRASAIARPALEFSPGTALSLVDASVLAATSQGYTGWTPDVVARDAASGQVGVLSPQRAATVPDNARGDTPVGKVMEWSPVSAAAPADERGDDLLRRLELNGFPWVLVLDPERTVVGVVHHRDLARHITGR